MRLLLRLYPRAWRERYGAEMVAVLDDVRFDLRTAVDLVACAADAHLHPPGGRGPWRRPLALDLAALVVLGVIAFPFLDATVETHVLIGGASALGYVLVPVAGALVAWRLGWTIAAWFCALVAVQRALFGGQLMWDLLVAGRVLLEPLRVVAVLGHPAWFRLAWPFAAAVAAALGVIATVVLRRLGATWAASATIGMVLIASTAAWAVYDYAAPTFAIWHAHPTWFRLSWLVDVAQVAAWGGLTAVLLRRAGLTWWSGLFAGCVLWLFFGDPRFLPVSVGPLGVLWQLPGLGWASVLAALGSGGAHQEVAPC